MNAAQYKMAYALLNKLSLTDQKDNIVAGFSTARKNSMRELSHEESTAFLRWLKEQDTEHKKGDKMRKRIISMAHEMGWHKQDATGKLLLKNGKPVADMPRIDGWCKEYGYLSKGLDSYTYKELPKLLWQFTEVYNDYLQKV